MHKQIVSVMNDFKLFTAYGNPIIAMTRWLFFAKNIVIIKPNTSFHHHQLYTYMYNADWQLSKYNFCVQNLPITDILCTCICKYTILMHN